MWVLPEILPIVICVFLTNSMTMKHLQLVTEEILQHGHYSTFVSCATAGVVAVCPVTKVTKKIEVEDLL